MRTTEMNPSNPTRADQKATLLRQLNYLFAPFALFTVPELYEYEEEKVKRAFRVFMIERQALTINFEDFCNTAPGFRYSLQVDALEYYLDAFQQNTFPPDQEKPHWAHRLLVQEVLQEIIDSVPVAN